MAMLDTYLNDQHLALLPTRRVIPRPRAQRDPSHTPSASPKSP